MPRVPLPPVNHQPVFVPVPPPIAVAVTATTAFVGNFGSGAPHAPQFVDSFAAFETLFPHYDPAASEPTSALWSFFANGGIKALIVATPSSDPADLIGDPSSATGIYALTASTPFNLLCIPEAAADPSVYTAAASFCEQQGAILLIDPPSTVNTVADAATWVATLPASPNAAAFFPRLTTAASEASAAPSGAIAGLHARTDAAHGVWKSATGGTATLIGFTGLSCPLSDPQNAILNPLAVNCIRAFPSMGLVLWGARTLAGADTFSTEWKYIPVRRSALMIQQSITVGVAWVSRYHNILPVWLRVTQTVQDFLMSLFRLGAFQGATPTQAFFVRCDGTNNTDADATLGVVNVLIGFAPLKPAEFIELRLTLQAAS